MYICTRDLNQGSQTFELIGETFEKDNATPKTVVLKDEEEDYKRKIIEITTLDILWRLFKLTDYNAGNYGICRSTDRKNKSIKGKIIDFRVCDPDT